MELALSDVVAATGGRLVPPVDPGPAHAAGSGGDGSWVIRGAATDSRAIQPGQLFVPVVGDRDGHDYIGAAIEAGAAAYLTSRPTLPGSPVPAVEVADTVDALAALGRLARERLGERVLAVTGSVGKTSVKDLLAAALTARWSTSAAVRSFNNELGVPLTLLNAPDDTEATVVEMGARGLGHVAELCGIARPSVGIVTMVGAAHLELFGSVDQVARAKGELVAALPAGGWAVLNADDPRVAAMAAWTGAQVVTYGTTGDVRAEAVDIDDELRPHFRLVSPWGAVDLALPVRGGHMVANALAAGAAALVLGLSPDEVAAGLAGATLSPWRMELLRTELGARIINDSYNANPVSMRAALQALASVPGAGRRVAVLGLMAELGPDGEEAHLEVAALADELGVELLAVGTTAYGVSPLDDHHHVVRHLGELSADDAVLVKASRVVGLERLAELLVGRVP